MDEKRIIELEIQTTHLSQTVEELSEVVARQAREIDDLTRHVRMLLGRLAEQDPDGDGGATFGDRKPPRW